MVRAIGIAAALVLFAQGCTVNEVVTAEETELVVASEPVDERMLLDVGIIEFQDGVPEDNNPDKTGIYGEIRQAEARYLPYHLKTTMQGTGHWGAVRVVPSTQAFTDVQVSGAVEKSNGEYVTLTVDVRDATGRHWFERDYTTQTGTSSYSTNRDRRQDPYQKVFNDVANDIYAYAQSLPKEEIARIRLTSELQFFADMSPTPYADYLATDEEGMTTLVRLPADGDPAVDRLRQIRERDRLVIDTLNEHYANFYYGIAIPYHAWRKTAREEAINYRQVRRSGTLRALMGVAVLAGSLAMETGNSSSSSVRRTKRSLQAIGISQGIENIFAGFTRRSEARLHAEAIRELSESFGSEAAPMLVTVEGETRRLTGTAAAQYEAWRRLLKQIYEAETGFADEAVEMGAPERVPET
jgi:hypothetical protein